MILGRNFDFLKNFEIFENFRFSVKNLGWPVGGSDVVKNFFFFFWSKDIQNWGVGDILRIFWFGLVRELQPENFWILKFLDIFHDFQKVWGQISS